MYYRYSIRDPATGREVDRVVMDEYGNVIAHERIDAAAVNSV